MQTGNVGDADRERVLAALAAEGALRDIAEPEECDWRGGHDGYVRHRSAMFGFRIALPLAVGFWGLMAGLVWAAMR